MMMLNVMIVVAIPGMAHERIQQVEEQGVQRRPILGEDTIVVDVVVPYERVCAETIAGYDSMDDAVYAAEVVEEQGKALMAVMW
jgi:hypothetical protein